MRKTDGEFCAPGGINRDYWIVSSMNDAGQFRTLSRYLVIFKGEYE